MKDWYKHIICYTFDRQMTIKGTISAMLILLAGISFGQKKSIAEGLTALQANDTETAKNLIDSASVHEETKDLATTWYYRGFVYKKIYNDLEKTNKQSPARKEAILSFEKFFELDTVSELHETAFKSLKYLAHTLYNDAATSLSPSQYKSAIQNFEEHKRIMKELEPNSNFGNLDVQFNLVLGQVYNQMYEADRDANKSFFQKTHDAYDVVLHIDSNNLSANYNLGILYYNEAVNIIKNLDYDLDLITLELIQDECVQLFTQSLPYMLNAYKLNSKRKETLIGLAGIYFSLNEMEKSEEIQKQIEELEKLEEGE